MEKIDRKFYIKLGITEKDLLSINQELSLPLGLKLSPFARARRELMLKEAISWPEGKNQEKRKTSLELRWIPLEAAVANENKEMKIYYNLIYRQGESKANATCL